MADQRFSLPKLSNHNYQSWRFKMEMLLIREELWHVINEAKPQTVTDAWTKADLKARATIGLCVDDNQTCLIRSCASAKDCWNALKKYHEKGSEVYWLKKLTRLELSEDGNMEEHLQEFTELLQRIADTGEKIPKKWQVAMLLCSLPESFDPLVTAIEQRPSDELTVDLVKSKLMAEVEKRRERSGRSAECGEKAMRSDYSRYRGGARGDNSAARVCYHCGKPGHLKRNCRGLKSEDETRSIAASQEEEKAQGASFTNRSVAFVAGQEEPAAWFVDSGASRHMTGERKFFTKFKKTAGVEVTLADGEKAEAAGIGSGSIVGVDGRGERIKIVLNEVLYVPGLAGGLVSVSTMAAKGFSVLFTENRCEVRDRSGRISVLAKQYGGLYRL